MIPASRPVHRQLWLFVTGAGWLALAGGLFLVRPFFGVVSPVTWTLVGGFWLWVIAVPGLAAWRMARQGLRWSAASFAILALVAAIAVWVQGWPQLTPEGQFRHHRAELRQLAALYRAGQIAGDVDLPWRSHLMSVDGQAHVRCGSRDSSGAQQCALYLPMWQDWRAENGYGIAYFPVPPDSDAVIATAAGDMGSPIRALGDGWWLVS